MYEITGCESLSDAALLAATRDSAERGRKTDEEMLRQLGEIERRRRVRAAGYPPNRNE